MREIQLTFPQMQITLLFRATFKLISTCIFLSVGDKLLCLVPNEKSCTYSYDFGLRVRVRGGTLVADARDQQPFEPGEWGLESCSLRAFLREPPCRTCKKHPAGIWLQDYGCGSPDQNKQTKHIIFTNIWIFFMESVNKLVRSCSVINSKCWPVFGQIPRKKCISW